MDKEEFVHFRNFYNNDENHTEKWSSSLRSLKKDAQKRSSSQKYFWFLEFQHHHFYFFFISFNKNWEEIFSKGFFGLIQSVWLNYQFIKFYRFGFSFMKFIYFWSFQFLLIQNQTELTKFLKRKNTWRKKEKPFWFIFHWINCFIWKKLIA